MMNVVNPATEEIISQLQEDDRKSIESKFNLCRQAQVKWKERQLNERILILAKFQDLLRQSEGELAAILTEEMGKPLVQSKSEIKGACGRIEFFLNNSQRWLEEELISDKNGLIEKIVYEPLGIIANISAWNYPYLVGVNVFVPALIGGNGVMYKPSEWASLTGLKIGQLLERAGVPKDVFQVILGAGDSGQALLEIPLAGYFFTGSFETGNYIYKTVAHKMVPCQLELGGKDPLYVSNDNTNLQRVASIAAEGAFYNNGQSCCAVERIYVHREVYEGFVEAFLKEVEKWPVGNPFDDSTFFGPVARKSQLKVLDDQVQDALRKGARLLLGGHRMDRTGYFFSPTILENVNHSMNLMKDETFGPVIGIQQVENDHEALQLMQDTDFGLTGSVFSDSYEVAESLLCQLQSGTVYWNCADAVSARLPWSGRKKSGIGSTLSYQGIRAFVQPKAYHLKNLK